MQYITAAWAYYVTGERGGRKVGAEKREKGWTEKEGKDRKCKETKVK